MSPEIMDFPLSGKVLIEASAGTGKTYTLTGILLRLLLSEVPSKGIFARAPEAIIATTFTRKAAAEMRMRLKMRLNAMHHLLQALAQTLLQSDEEETDYYAHIAHLLTLWAENAQTPAEKAAQESLNHALVLEAVQENGIDGFTDLCQRCNSVIATLDRLFIGTLDSLCQHWLRMFSLETGTAQSTKLVDGHEEITEIVHQQLRQFYWQYSDYHKHLSSINPPAHYAKAISGQLNYADAAVDEIDVPSDENFAALLEQAKNTKMDDFLALFASQKIVSKLTDPELLWQALLTQTPIDEENIKIIETWHNAVKTGEGFLKAAKSEQIETICQHDCAPIFLAVTSAFLAQKNLNKTLAACAAKETLLAVRAQLPAQLEMQGKATFNHYTARLNQALAGESGAALARYIAHRYPVLLVDESQDLNAQQAQFIERIYLKNLEADRHFLLLVGDPKQAIYRFRGGDVANYLRLKAAFSQQECYSLTKNYRSSPALIAALNTLYQDRAAFGGGIDYEPMTAAVAQRALQSVDGAAITPPLYWLETKNDNEHLAIVHLIQNLTAKNSIYAYHDKQNRRPLRYSDILVLGTSRSKLEELQILLQQHGINVDYSAEKSIFASDLAAAITTFLAAMLAPQQQEQLNRLFISPFFRLSLAELTALSQPSSALNYAQLSAVLTEAEQLWQQKKLLSALQLFLTTDFAGLTIWERLARLPYPENERALLDLRQLQQIIADRGRLDTPDQFLRWWKFMLTTLPTADWAKMMPLPSQDALRLMTIHSAKGLQAPVVIISGLRGKHRKHDALFYPYHTATGDFRIATEKVEENQQEDDDEKARLLYVGLTRAEDLLFVALQSLRKKDGDFFADAHAGMKRLDPVRFKNTAVNHGFLSVNPEELAQRLTQPQYTLSSASETIATIEQDPTYPRQRFYGWSKSSFTALTRYVDENTVDISLPDYAEEEAESETIADPDLALPARFARGTKAGSFLHQLLKDLPETPAQFWRGHIERLAKQYRLLERTAALDDYAQYEAWFQAIMASPLVSQTTLAALSPAQKVDEMKFILHVAGKSFNISAVNRLFERWEKPLTLHQKQASIRFLCGEIDFCYQQDDKYYFIDYKSNYLGTAPQEYHVSAMKKAMNEHHYWLQALIYQTALHRFLQTRLKNYQPALHLGCPEYFFIRGVDAEEQTLGHFPVDLPLDLVLEFDAILSGH